MVEGTVTYFDDEGGYGFIEVEDEDDDVFFHMSENDEEEDLQQGEEVKFNVEQGDKGPRASDLERVNGE